MRHADHGIMPVERAAVQADRVVARHDRHVLAVGKFVVQIAAEIKIAVAVCRCGTHGARPPSFIHPVSISAAPGRMLKNLKSSCVQSVSFCARRRRNKTRAVLLHRPQGTRKSNAPVIFCASVSLDYPLNCSHAQSQLHLPFLTIEEFRLSGYKDNEKLASSAAWSAAHLRAQTQESASGVFQLTRTG